MSERTKIIIVIVFILGLPFFWWRGIGEVFSYFQSSSTYLKTEVVQEPLPLRNAQIADLQINSQAALSLLLDDHDRKTVLFNSNQGIQLPIASLTKLMTALIVIENYDLQQEVKISLEAVSQEGDFGQLEINRVYPVEYLLYPLLMESSNDAAYALVHDYAGMDLETFLGLMNERAQSLRMSGTYFLNPTGLEPQEDKRTTGLNRSTAADLAKLTVELLKKPLIWQILSLPQYNVFGPELRNTNILLSDETINWRSEIVGAKTGYTLQAGGCILLVMKAPNNRGHLINVILGTENNDERFNQMKKMVEWLKTAYLW